jgi:SAM-dependent methyltransferase
VSVVETIHGGYIARRRARVIADHFASLAPPNASVLDVGCGDGEIASLVGRHRPDLRITGVDVLVREDTQVPVKWFDGRALPVPDNSFDVVSFIDVLHHCDRPMELLSEASRVARHAIIIKDHFLQGFAAERTLRFMDGVGNRRHGVALPYNYWRPEQWASAFLALGLTVEHRIDRLGLYPWLLSALFGRGLHFMAQLSVPTARETAAGDVQELLEYAGIS